jgi:hypothetical protein
VPVTEDGKSRLLPTIDVIFRRLRNDAFRGDMPAIKVMLALYERYQSSQEQTADFGELLAEDREILESYLPVAKKASNRSPSRTHTKRRIRK